MINERKVVEIATLNNLLTSGGAKFLQGLQSNGSISVDAGASGNTGAIRLSNAAHKFAMHISAANTVGLYDQTYSKWMLSCDSSGNVIYAGGSVSGSLSIPTTEAANRFLRTYNNKQDLAFGVWADGTAGIWDYKNNKWLIQSDASHNITLNGSAVSANTLNNTNPPVSNGLQYTAGGRTIGTAAGNAKEGTSADYKLWCYPAGATAVSGTTANVMNLRFSWGTDTNYFHDLFMSPNYADLYHRWVNSGNTSTEWYKILDSNNYTNYAAAKVTITNDTGTNTWRALVGHNGSSSLRSPSANLCYIDQPNNTTTSGTFLSIGNGTATGTAGNKRGILRLYGSDTQFVDIYGSASSSSKQVYTPNTNGRLAAIPDASAAVGNTNTPVYVTADGVVTSCTINKSGSWQSNAVVQQAGQVVEIGKYIDFHEGTSKNDYDARISSSLTGLWISTKNAQVVGNENLRNIKAATTDLTAGSSALTTGVIYLVYE